MTPPPGKPVVSIETDHYRMFVQAKDYRKKLIKQLYEGVLGRPLEPEVVDPPPPPEPKSPIEFPIKIAKPSEKVEPQ